MNKERKRNWYKFWVHFFFGAMLGASFGLRVWSRSSYAASTSALPGVVFVGGGALLAGLVAGALADTGWDERL
jgi:hypothetical protein